MRHPLSVLATLRGRWNALTGRRTMEGHLTDEIRFHLEMETEKNLKAGMTPDEAHRVALVTFGGVDRATESHRDARGTRFIEDTIADLRYATRTLRRSPGLVVVSVGTLAIAVAIGTSVFTAANGFLFRPLPVPAGRELLSVFTSDFNGRELRGGTSIADLADFARETTSLAVLSAEASFEASVGVGDDGSLVNGALVSGRYFETLRLRPALGRFDAPAAAPAVVLSNALWRRAFGSDSGIIGRRVSVNGQPFIVIGVAPPEFRGTRREHADEFWIDAGWSRVLLPRSTMLERRADRIFHVIGRVTGPATPQTLEAKLNVVAAQLRERDPDAWRDTTGRTRRVTVMAEAESNLEGAASEAWLLIGGVVALGLALVAVASMNLASLQMARAADRRREIATRLALGAARGRLIRQLITESTLIAVMGAALGVGITAALGKLFSQYQPIGMPSLDLGLDLRVLGVVCGGLVVIVLVFGLVPALQAVRVDVLSDLKGSEGVVGRLAVGRVRSGLIVTQVAMAVAFTAASVVVALALLERTTEGRDQARRIIVAPMAFLPGAGDSSQVGGLMRDLIQSVASIPGVQSATAARIVPMRGLRMTVSGEVTGGQHPGKNEIEVNGIQPGYFDVTGLKILRGRDFNRADFAFGSPVAIVSREMARAFWGTEEVLGKRIRVNDDVAPVSIVGVVSELPSTVAANDESHGLLYLPMRPRADQGVILQARIGEVDPRVLGAQIVAQLRRFPRRVAPTEAMTLDEYYDRQLLPQRLLASGSAGLAALQFLLAMAGVSGLVAHMTTRRRREIGIRTALGAGRGDVLALVMRQGARLTAIGGTLGLLVGIAAGQIVAMAMPVSIPALVGALATAAVAVILVGGGAMLLPAWKALRVGPATALRYD